MGAVIRKFKEVEMISKIYHYNTVATKISKTVQLNEQPNVHLLYWTAWVDSNHVVNFRKDLYERDKSLIDALLSRPSF